MSNFKSLLGLSELSVDSLNILNLDLTNTNIVGLNTDRVPEDADPVNLYFTNSRFDTRLSTKTTDDIKEGKNLYYTDERFDNRIATKSIDALSDVVITGTPADNQLLIYSTGQWRNTASPFLRLDGTANMTGSINMGGQSITNVNLVDGIDVSVLDSSVVKLTGNQSIAGTKTFTDKITTAVGKPLIIGRATKGLYGTTGGLELYGNYADNIGGAHLQAITSEDDYPTFSLINTSHGSIFMGFDAYIDNFNWKSSYATSNFAIAKSGDYLRVFYDSNKSVGSIVQWENVAITIDTTGLLTTKAISATGLITANAGINMSSQSITNVNQLNGRTISTLYSEHDANTAKVSADGSINTHSDVLITGTPADNQLLIYSTGQWRNVVSPFLRLDGTANMTAGLNMGGFAISNVGNVDGVDVSVLDTSVVKLTGDQTIGGIKSFSSIINASAGIDAKSQKITNLLTPTATTDGANKTYVDTLDGQNVKLTTDQTIAGTKTFSNIINASLGIDAKSQKIINLLTPTLTNDATNKSYVDTLDGQNVKITGTQTIGGAKTFSSAITASLGISSSDIITTTAGKPIVIGNTSKSVNGATGGLELYGTASDPAGPHIQAITTADGHPVFQMFNFAHNDINFGFDAYVSGGVWKSSSVTSNFVIQKGTNLTFRYKSGISAGTTISSWGEAMNISSAGAITATGAITANGGLSTTTISTSDNITIGAGKSLFIDRSGATLTNKLVLWDGGTPSATAFLGFGVASATLIYNVNASTDSHVFYYGGTNELFRINNTAITATKSIIANGGLNMNSQNITNTGSLNGRVVSTLFSEHDVNKAKVSADGSIDTHSDVVITGPVVNGQLLTYNGTNWVNSTGALSFLALTGGTMSGDVKYGASAFTLYTAPQAMTSNNSGGFVASASNEYYPAYYAFNADQNDYWSTAIYYNDTTGVYTRTPATTNTWGGTPYTGEFIKIDLGAIYKIKTYYVRSSSANFIETTPSIWYVGTSSDNITYTLWDSQTGQAWASQTTKTYTPASNATARYIIFIVNKTGSGGTNLRSQPRIASLYFDYETFNYDITNVRNISGYSLTTSGAITATGAITASGLITANAGITGTTLTASGLITANAGVSGTTLTASGLITANAGISVVNSSADIRGEARSGSHGTPVGLYVTGGFGPASSGVEFRHSNGTQGIGFGYNSIYAAGSDGNQNINFYAKGSGSLIAQSNFYTSALLVADGGSRISVQNQVDGGSNYGLYMWDTVDSNWGIYMSTSGAGKALNGGIAPAALNNDFTSHAIRFRAYNTSGNGFIWENSSNVCRMSLRADNGQLVVPLNVYVYSDKRLKTDIKECPGLELINKINPVCFRMIEDKTPLRMGMLAQELDEILQDLNIPDFAGLSKTAIKFPCEKQNEECKKKGLKINPEDVKMVENGDYSYSIAYPEFIAPLIKSVQQLSEKIDNLGHVRDLLEKQNKNLMNIIEDLSKQLAEIRAEVFPPNAT